MLHNSALYIALAAGAAKAGFALVTLNYRFTGPDIAYHLGDAGAVAIIYDTHARAAVRDAQSLLPRLRGVIAESGIPGSRETGRWRAPRRNTGVGRANRRTRAGKVGAIHPGRKNIGPISEALPIQII
jgi:acyl-CoA synthetase (AMP-forming)/AMP-acid ligase II